MAPKAFDVWDREKFWCIHELSDSDSHLKDIPARPLINVGWSGQLDQAMQLRWTQPLFGYFRDGWSALPSWLITSGQYRLKGKPRQFFLFKSTRLYKRWPWPSASWFYVYRKNVIKTASFPANHMSLTPTRPWQQNTSLVDFYHRFSISWLFHASNFIDEFF